MFSEENEKERKEWRGVCCGFTNMADGVLFWYPCEHRHVKYKCDVV